MSAPRDRIGVFIIPPANEAALTRASEGAESLMLDDPPGWCRARHELFEQALEVSLGHRILDGDEVEAVERAWTDFVVHLKRDLNQDVDTLSPVALRGVLAKYLGDLDDDELRGAIADLLGGPDGGIWVLTEAAIPPMYADDGTAEEEDDSEPVDVQDLTRKLLDFSERSRERPPIERVSVCELDKASVKDAASAPNEDRVGARARVRARARIDETDPAIVEAARAVVATAPASRGRGVYDVEGTRALLAWLEDSETPARSWMLPAVRHAVEAKRGIAIVFDVE